MMSTNPPPPPPLPPAPKTLAPAPVPAPAPEKPEVAENGPPGAFLVGLLVYNGYPYKDHWVHWVRSPHDKNVGNYMHAT